MSHIATTESYVILDNNNKEIQGYKCPVCNNENTVVTYVGVYCRKCRNSFDESDFMALLKKEVGGKTVNKYLKELKDAGKVHFVGNPRIVKGKNIGYWELDVMNSK